MMLYYKELNNVDFDGENWRDVLGYEGRYQVSCFGRIKSLPRKWKAGTGVAATKGGILKQRLDHDGYATISFWNKTIKVHRLVALAFILNPLNKPVINHKNGIRYDNCIDNLEWCTQQENVQDSFDKGRSKSWFTGKKNELNAKSKRVLCIQTNEEFPSGEEAARIMNLNPSHINSICNNKIRKTTKGYSFKFI